MRDTYNVFFNTKNRYFSKTVRKDNIFKIIYK